MRFIIHLNPSIRDTSPDWATISVKERRVPEPTVEVEVHHGDVHGLNNALAILSVILESYQQPKEPQ